MNAEVPHPRVRIRWSVGVLALAVVALDQLTKSLARDAWELGEGVDLPAGMALRHIENTGVAFGLLSGTGPGIIVGSVIVACILLVLIGRIPAPDRWTRVGLGLLAGGALGNVIDRIWQGAVTDFLDPGFFPVFNIADIGITVGVVCVLIGQLRAPASAPTGPDA